MEIEKVKEEQPELKIIPKKKRGGYRPGSGRKTAIIEHGVREAINRAVEKRPGTMTKIWEKVLEKAEGGSDKHITILFQYYYGKPMENVNVTSKQLILKRIIVGE